MEFNDQFYQNLFQLVTSPARKEASAELLRILNDVQEHYATNGITEFWRDAHNPSSDQDSVPLNIKHVDKPTAPVKREVVLTEFDNPKQPHSPYVEKMESDSPNDTQDSLKIVANLEEDDESVDVIQQSSDCLGKIDQDQRTTSVIVQQSSSTSLLNPDQLDNFSSAMSSIPLDVDASLVNPDPYYNTPSPKIRRVAFDSKLAIAHQQKGIKSDHKTKLKQEDRWGDESGIACAVCKQLTSKPGNCLLECHECHTWFHQKCHEPNVSDINDSRTLWYCNKCGKKAKKPATSALPGQAHEKSKISQKEKSNADAINKQKDKDALKEKQRLQLIEAAAKRVEHKHGPPLAKPVALLAADFLAKHKNRPAAASMIKSSNHNVVHHTAAFPSLVAPPTSGFGHTNVGLAGLSKLPPVQRNIIPTGGQAVVPGSTSVQAAEKRLQMMKKKAAGKTSNK